MTKTNAFLVAHGGRIVYERYYNGYSRNSYFPSYSVAKAITSTATALAIKDGFIKSTNADARQYWPSTLAAKFRQPVTISDLLNMRAAIPVQEQYDSVFSLLAQMYVTTDLKRFMQQLPPVHFSSMPHFEYRSATYLLLGETLRGAVNDNLAPYISTALWKPIGAESNASWSVDSSDSRIEKSFCCINAKARDFVRFGLFVLEDGKYKGSNLLPAGWQQKIQKPTAFKGEFGYSHGWWMLKDRSDPDFSAIGIHGQYVYINPKTNTVIVKFSDYGAEQDEALTLRAFRKISHLFAE
ncbi:beta-lactamase family protein [Chitiniphilus purpureus]|uniref:Beta-lactamase family protein n=1 Tax=Chitiniphilus purpureus TaxID=2981137 RepID=A0ABY6DLE2_9NEIS|nr:serine hydrolase [Chitiniphilus sp. CD1]UXY15185.1 beta-lactamase family protein [Chitiniphilus sp. CD1]